MEISASGFTPLAPTLTSFPFRRTNHVAETIAPSSGWQTVITPSMVDTRSFRPEVSSIYWPSPCLLGWEVGRSTANNSRIAELNELGKFSSTDIRNSKISKLRGTRGYMEDNTANLTTSQTALNCQGLLTDITETWMGMIVDPTLEGKFNEAEMSVLVKVALQCVQEDKDARPTMGEVVQILLHLVEKQ
ncbi:hypothetical protein F3Y22_tig00116997pilonHSYRG00939 [Hibiscus syriacus]|uniref:Uncharacterized protein n=1 Tax=Hibiscus syriacus TaxID=106335 RepID=A0A6A2XKU3_HIBSY|nr:hypothetical protein F3Y22_tig00116997pilonHSYRG00939 [Hibiscus syriacus]